MKFILKMSTWLCAFMFIINVYSQSYYTQYEHLITENNPTEILKEVNRLLDSCTIQKAYEEKIKIAHSFALQLYYNGENEMAITYGLIDVTGYEKELQIKDTKYSSALFNLGLFYKENRDITAAIFNFKKVIETKNYPKKIGQAYCQLGASFNTIGDLYKAVDYYKKGLEILKTENQVSFVTNALDLTWVYEEINTPNTLDAKIKLLKSIETIIPSTSLPLDYYVHLYKEIASYYNNDNVFDFKESKRYYDKCVNLLVTNDETENLDVIYTSLGNLYMDASKDSTLYYLKKGLEYSREKDAIARNYNITSHYYLTVNQPENAIVSSDNSLKASLGITTPELTLDTINLLEQSIDKDVTIWALINKAEALLQYYYKEKLSTQPVTDALYHLKKADELITAINQNEFEENSQLYWQEEAIHVYSNAVICNHILGKPKEAFGYIEKSKTFLLNQAISRNISKYQLPEDTGIKNFEFKKQILDLQYRLDTIEDSTQKLEIEDALFSKKVTYEVFEDSLKNVYPEYQVMNTQILPATTAEIQKQLDDTTTVIAYSWTNDNKLLNSLSIITVSKNDVNSFLINDTQELEKLLIQYIALVSQPLQSKDDFKTYNEIAYTLYTHLFPDELASQVQGKKLIIIPDGNLQYTPFEALVTRENSSDFLIQESMISYAYSMTSLVHNNTLKRTASTDLMAFSPVSFKNKNLIDLEYTTQEVEAVRTIASGEVFIKENASTINFLQKSGDAKIIHLATHASASRNPWIAFNDKNLQLHELYTYKNQAELVVLSACNTSLGEMNKGEGVLSLARGFFYSGAKSIISTLWNANDKSSSVVMQGFYTNIKKGETKAMALHNAKITYLNTHSLSETAPYYWASFILIGDTEEIILSDNSTMLLYSVLIIGMILIGGYFLRRKQKRSNI